MAYYKLLLKDIMVTIHQKKEHIYVTNSYGELYFSLQLSI